MRSRKLTESERITLEQDYPIVAWWRFVNQRYEITYDTNDFIPVRYVRAYLRNWKVNPEWIPYKQIPFDGGIRTFNHITNLFTASRNYETVYLGIKLRNTPLTELVIPESITSSYGDEIIWDHFHKKWFK